VNQTVRWGIVGPGGIATDFAEAMQHVDGGEIVAVSSRSQQRADAFGQRFGITHRYANDDDLAADGDVDIVYVATPQNRHEADTIRYVAAGKHVLCEKPFAMTSRQAQNMVDAGRSRGVFLMDAVWSRFLPAYRALDEVLRSGRIGEPLLVEADFGFRLPVDPEHRLFDPSRGGGALLDLGIYPVQLCALVLGPIESVAAEGHVGETGVDEWVAAVLRHAGGKLGVAKASIRVGTPCTARISGSDGWVDLPAFMHCPTSITVNTPAGRERIDGVFEHGLKFEIEHVHECLADGLIESPVMRLDETIALMDVLDAIRAQIEAPVTR
jgi:predicted dehydrogenase